MAQVRCYCGVHTADPQNATYVRNGVPMCNEHTCQKVKEYRNLRRAPHFDDIGFDVVCDQPEQHFVVNEGGNLVPYDHPDDGYVPEPYARNRKYTDI